MAYTKQTWQNGEAGGTPINATRLNNMEGGIEQAHEIASDAQGTATSASAVAQTAAERATNAQSSASDANAAAGRAVSTANSAADQAQSAYSAATRAQSAAEAAQSTADLAQETADSALLVRHAEYSGRNNSAVAAGSKVPITISAVPSAMVNNDFCTITSVASEIKVLSDGVYAIDFYAGLPTNVATGTNTSYISIRSQDESVTYAQLDLQQSSWGNSVSASGIYLQAGTILKMVFVVGRQISAGDLTASVRITKF